MLVALGAVGVEWENVRLVSPNAAPCAIWTRQLLMEWACAAVFLRNAVEVVHKQRNIATEQPFLAILNWTGNALNALKMFLY